MNLELQVASALLFRPSEIKTHYIDPNWFRDQQLKEIVQSVIATNGEETDIYMIQDEIARRNPMTKVTAEDIYNVQKEAVTSAHLKRHSKALERRFVEERLATASIQYGENRSDKGLAAVQSWMDRLDNLTGQEKNGDINGALDRMLYKLEHEMDPGIMTYPSIDKILGGGLAGSRMITIGARPAMGKSAIAINLVIEAIKRQEGLYVDLFTLEMSEDQTIDRFVSRIGEINSYSLRNPNEYLTKEQKQKVVMITEMLRNKNIKIHDDARSIKQIARRIRSGHALSNGKYIAIIDYLGLVKADSKYNQRHLEVGEITRIVKELSIELNVPIIVLSQLNRAVENRQVKEPTLADLRESGSIEQDSDIVMFLHQPEEEAHNMEIIIAKNRDGATNKLKFNFFKSKMYFEEFGG